MRKEVSPLCPISVSVSFSIQRYRVVELQAITQNLFAGAFHLIGISLAGGCEYSVLVGIDGGSTSPAEDE